MKDLTQGPIFKHLIAMSLPIVIGMLLQTLYFIVDLYFVAKLAGGYGLADAYMGVAGAALASTIAVAVGVIMLAFYFLRLEHYVGFDVTQWTPKLATWRRMLNLGLPAGVEFALFAVFTAVIYWIIRDFGAAAQAGFGIGGRIMQMIFLPAMAIAFSAAPIAGQNFGGKSRSSVSTNSEETSPIAVMLAQDKRSVKRCTRRRNFSPRCSSPYDSNSRAASAAATQGQSISEGISRQATYKWRAAESANRTRRFMNFYRCVQNRSFQSLTADGSIATAKGKRPLKAAFPQ